MQRWDQARMRMEFGDLDGARRAQAAQRRKQGDLTAVVSLMAARSWERAFGRYEKLGEERDRLPFVIWAVVAAKGAGQSIKGATPQSPDERKERQKTSLREIVREAIVQMKCQQG